jgi:GntR family transcriptional regulator
MPRRATPVSVAEEISVDRASPVPLYFQVAQQLEQAISSGRVTPGTRLPNELKLAHELSLSRPTMRRAMEYLVDKGLVVRQRGVGTRVVSPTVRRSLNLSSLYDDLDSSGQRPRTAVLSNEVVEAPPDIAGVLGVLAGTPVIEIVRLRSALDQPIARMTNYLPSHRASITTEALERTGLYDLLRRAGVHLHSATQVIGARAATAAEARLLDERKSSALLTMQRTAYDDHGRVVEYGSHVYAASRYTFQMSLRSG